MRDGSVVISGFARLEGRVSLDDEKVGAVEGVADDRELDSVDVNRSGPGKGNAVDTGGM